MPMRLTRDGQTSSRRLLMWFALTAILPAAALAWFGWSLAKQDRALDADRRRGARDRAAELAASRLQDTLLELETQATALNKSAPPLTIVDPDISVVVFGTQDLHMRGGRPLLYHPVLPRSTRPALASLAQADTLELQGNDLDGAQKLVEPLVSAIDAEIRGEALLRVGRLKRKRGDIAGALAAFDALAALDATMVNGVAAGLLGAQARALALEASPQRRVPHVERLRSDLLNGRWPLSRAQFEFSLQQTRDWLGTNEQARDSEATALAAVAQAIWTEWRRDAGGFSTSGRRTVRADGVSVLVLTRNSADTIALLLAGPRFLERRWRDGALLATRDDGVDLALSDAEGLAVLGDPAAALDRQSVRTASMTRLPWTVHAISREAAGPHALSAPAVLMLGGLGMMTLVVVAGGYLISRAMARELRVARLQSNFVSAVSHEFRTPLTTVRQLSEMLVRGRVSTEAKRQEFYETLLRESERLHRLVESLLNFARLEAGQLKYHFEAVPLKPFMEDLVTEFQGEGASRAVRIVIEGRADVARIKADRELLARVFWNLLDNAVKYSPEGGEISVEIESSSSGVDVRVRDRGMGIPADEQQEIFRRFVRGSASTAASIKGTGIGLAMAREIVRAHGGEIRVESRVGHGSTFTVSLPTDVAEAGAWEPTVAAGAGRR